MKVAPNQAAFTALSNNDFKKVARPKVREEGVRVSDEAGKNKLKVEDAKLTARLDQVKVTKKADSARADREARIDANRERVVAERRSREAPRPRSSGGQRKGQHVDIRV